MTTFEVIDARPWHCGAMARKLRIDHKRAIVRIGWDAHHELRNVYQQSPTFRRAWLIDGKVEGVGGVVRTMASGIGAVWLALSEGAMQRPRAVVREARSQLSEIMGMVHTLRTTIVMEDERSVAFARHLGFEPTGEEFLPGVIFFERSR